MSDFASSQISINSGTPLYNTPFKKKKPEDLYTTTPIPSGQGTPKITLPSTTTTPINGISDPSKYGFTQNIKSVNWGPGDLIKNNQPTTSPTITPSTTSTGNSSTLNPFTPKVTSTPAQSYLDDITKIANESKKFYNDTAASNEALVNKYYDRKNNAAVGEANVAQEGFNQFEKTTNENADQSKAQAETQWGNDQRALAQTRRESEGRLRNKFAGQNTSDSFGAGSALEANTNLESDFNRQTAQGLQGKSNQIFKIDQDAKTAINAEALKLKDTLLKIQNTVYDNEDQRAAAVKKAYDDAKAGILEINSNLANMKYQNAQATGQGSLSDQFLKTGIPTTPAEFQFLQNNKDAFANIGTGGINAGRQQIRSAIDDVLGSGGIDKVYGWGSVNPLNNLPASQAQDVKAKVERLKGLVSLENANKLKGQGQISDAERQMLANAATVLNNPKISPQEAILELQRLKQQFTNPYGTTNNQSFSSPVMMLSPDGKAYTVDPSEVQTALQNGWRQQ